MFQSPKKTKAQKKTRTLLQQYELFELVYTRSLTQKSIETTNSKRGNFTKLTELIAVS